MIKHRLMLSAAAAALLTAVMAAAAARADTEITTSTSTELNTTSAGTIVIDAGGSISIAKSGVAAVTLNSANTVTNNGALSNAGTDGGVGVLIDTSAGNIVSTNGFISTGSIDVSGANTTKRGIVIQGGHTFYGPITLTTLTATSTLTGQTAATQQSSLIV
ncbi:MAG TPA: hypothetical protein VLL04_03330, partial [Rhizomicrobium sp.]|nr:hypothetical protein [Rhizomicrobium sp.]